MPQALPWNSLKAVSICAHAARDAAVAAGQEELRLAVLEVGVQARVEEGAALDAKRGNPVFRVRVQPVRELDELAQISARQRGLHLDGHGAGPYMPTAIDLFEKARRHERLERLCRRHATTT